MNYTTPKHIGDHNKNQMLSILRENGKVSRVELSRMLGISGTAVTRNIAALIEKGTIRECGSEDSSIGRKPVLLELCSDYCYVIAADVVGGSVKVAFADLSGNILKLEEQTLPISADAAGVMECLIQSIEHMIEVCKVPKEKIWIIAVGTPGIFDAETGKSQFAFFLDGWEDIDIRREIEQKLSIDTVIENDVTLDIIGECWHGDGKDFDNVLFIKLGQGLASRIMLNGKLLRGEHQMAGEIGYMLQGNSVDGIVNYETLICNAALVEYYHKEGGKNRVHTLSDLLRCKKAGDKAAEKVITYMLEKLSIVLTNEITVIDPEIVILGGDASHLEEMEIHQIQSFIQKCFPLNQTILPSRLDKKACIHGAVRIALNWVEEHILGDDR